MFFARLVRTTCVLCLAAVLTARFFVLKKPNFVNGSIMTEKELRKIIGGMSLKEKALELTHYNASDIMSGFGANVVTGMCVSDDLTPEEFMHLGTILNNLDDVRLNELRRKRIENGITDPIVVMQDVIHGYRTNYPIPLAMSCSFNMELIEECAEMAAVEAKFAGVDLTFSPMVDLSRDARWGRVMESAGEDPYLAGEVGKAFIRGYHKGGVACCVKHFAGYGAAEAGRDYNTTDISEHCLDEYYLKPYEACMKEKPEAVMTSFNLLNGIPVLGNRKLLVEKLREKWGFDGVLISDYNAVREMINHGYKKDLKDCAETAINSKLDVEMCSPAYAENLEKLVKKGKVKESDVDECVLRVLELKNKLGLYENPYGKNDPKKSAEVTLCSKNRKIALKAAEESIVLLKNNAVLPLDDRANVAFVGPFADEKEIYGGWGCMATAEETVSVKEGIENLLGRKIRTEKGCSFKLSETDECGIEGAVRLAEPADVIVCCVGEHMNYSSESNSRTDIRITPVQLQLIKELGKLKKPLVLVVFGGRPLVLSDVERFADAILYVWQPGTEGGNAIANVLYGRANPSAKTSMSFPRAVGQCPIYYNRFNTGRPKPNDDAPCGILSYVSGYIDECNSPLYPFGYGLSYAEFEYSDFKISSGVLSKGGKITASVKVKNTGRVEGKEVVEWYIRDKFASCVRPLSELKGFEKIKLNAGEEKVVTFDVTEDVLAFYNADGEFVAEPGDFSVMVGGSSDRLFEKGFILE